MVAEQGRRRDKGGMAEYGRRCACHAHVSSYSPLAKTSHLITSTEFREKNRLPASKKQQKPYFSSRTVMIEL